MIKFTKKLFLPSYPMFLYVLVNTDILFFQNSASDDFYEKNTTLKFAVYS